MKKNRMLKLASAMVILCLITTCAISTTFAKYTTGGSVNDAARVAKWGVEVTMDGDPMFSNTYAGGPNGISVKADAKVVAPGTSSDEVSGALRFALTGTPEVSTKITISLDGVKDVWLKAGDYYDGTKATIENDGVPAYATFNLAADYYPVVFTLKQISGADGTYTEPRVLCVGTLADLQTFFATYSATAAYEPNAVLNATFELSWAWAFENNSQADTLLGHLIADTVPATAVAPAADDYNLTVAYTLNITVEQID
ncbi:MAG: hypothetical protein IKT32_02475 [Clostridia bacterium]|nr:hypothetical protein [Clostridia bacterium]